MIEEFKNELVNNKEVNERIKNKLLAIDKQNYNTIKKVAQHQLYENEMKTELLFAMENVIEEQIEENEKLELELEDKNKHIVKLGDELVKYTGDANSKVLKIIRTEHRVNTKDEKIKKSRDLISKQLNKNKAITNN